MKKYVYLLARYLIAIAFCFSLPLVYLIFKPLTIYPVYLFFKIFNDAMISGNSIIIGTVSIEFIEACIAGSAYLLFLILNLITPMKLRKRIFSLLLGFMMLLVFNVARIIILAILLINGSAAFDVTHKIFWHLLSTIFVVGAWLLNMYIFRIKSIPAYSDIRALINQTKK